MGLGVGVVGQENSMGLGVGVMGQDSMEAGCGCDGTGQYGGWVWV